ncbi:hypothetical protein E1A91_D11G132800v1 [Gossypium mustelinum]|uniref:Uncharacterized protein n=1 Tax=Gossypium mustelinum TaxID=34275 RepID=A0A5D2SRN2_GOSMU|nr:hypothetical protein E1A91_D11G132800v1 [Gossypium mustelinum]
MILDLRIEGVNIVCIASEGWGGVGMGSKPWQSPAPTYRTLETFWDTDEDAPGPRCGHTLTAVAATKTQGPRLILFGGATAIEGGASSSSLGIS